jgi:hypothetical protein
MQVNDHIYTHELTGTMMYCKSVLGRYSQVPVKTLIIATIDNQILQAGSIL